MTAGSCRQQDAQQSLSQQAACTIKVNQQLQPGRLSTGTCLLAVALLGLCSNMHNTHDVGCMLPLEDAAAVTMHKQQQQQLSSVSPLLEKSEHAT